jgi:hypothetical protein
MEGWSFNAAMKEAMRHQLVGDEPENVADTRWRPGEVHQILSADEWD